MNPSFEFDVIRTCFAAIIVVVTSLFLVTILFGFYRAISNEISTRSLDKIRKKILAKAYTAGSVDFADVVTTWCAPELAQLVFDSLLLHGDIVEHEHTAGKYTLTDSGRAAFEAGL